MEHAYQCLDPDSKVSTKTHQGYSCHTLQKRALQEHEQIEGLDKLQEN